MKNKKLMIGFAILFFAVISMTMLASATIFPTYNNETDCRGCHGSDVSTRHHLLVVNGTHVCTDCHPVQFDNITQTYSTQMIRNCLICHPGKNHNGEHHILASQGLFVCSDCHPIKFDNVTQTYSPFVTWDCTVCHSTVLSIQNVVPTPTPIPTPVPTPIIQSAMVTNFAPQSPVANFVGDSMSFYIVVDQVTDITWTLNGIPVQSNGSITDAVYTNASATFGTWIVNATASNVNGNVTKTWEWNVTTPPPPPKVPLITSNFPLYPSVNDSVGSSRKFGISTDQNVSMQWLINGNQVQLDGNVNASSYNNTSAALGIWNVSAIASNINGTIMYSWAWNVYPPPTITSYSPISPVNDTPGTPRIFNITTDQIVNVTWYVNDIPIQSNDSVTDALYGNMSASPGIWNVSAVVTNDNGSVMSSWTWNVASILPSPPTITSSSPISPVNDTVGTSRRFNITINQTANVTWYINGSFVKSDNGVINANYTNTSAIAGVWNVSAIVINDNGSVSYSWIWNVVPIPPSPPMITSSSPISPVNDTVGTSRKFNITINQTANVTWYINSNPIQSNNSITNASYTNTSAKAGIWNVSAIVTNVNGSVMNSWIWNVTLKSYPPNITNATPSSPVNDTEGASRTFSITTNQTTDITWYVNNNSVQSNSSVTNAGYTNISASVGIWNVKANATNTNGNVTYYWIWNVKANPKPVTTIDLPSGKNGWYITNTIYLNATDNDGIKYTNYSIDGGAWISNNGSSSIPVPSSMTLNLKTPIVLLDGIHSVQYYSVDNLSAVESTKTQTIKIDATWPQITVNSPVNGSIYILNQNLIANWIVNDPVSGIATATGTYANGSPISTSSIGAKTFSVSAADNAGNTNKNNVTYYIRYNFSGFLQPIDADGSSIFKQGSKVNVRFRLSDAKLNNVATATAKFYFSVITPNITGKDLKPYSYDTPTIDGNFKYDSKNTWYYYNLDTKGLQTGTWQIRADINDGSSYNVNISLQK